MFYSSQPTYNPQMVIRGKPRTKGHADTKTTNYGAQPNRTAGTCLSFNNTYYPTSILEFSGANKNNKWHPTQKPIELTEYLIKTYSNENELILDNCAGSFTVAEACINTNRQYICIEQSFEYYIKGQERIQGVINGTTSDS